MPVPEFLISLYMLVTDRLFMVDGRAERPLKHLLISEVVLYLSA